MVDSSKPKAKTHYTATRRKKPVVEHEAVSHDEEKRTQNSVEFDAQEKQNIKNMPSQSISHLSWLCLFLSGILGGFIALGLFIGLQWARVLPLSFVENDAGDKKALQIAEIAKSQGEETIERLGRVVQEIDTLKTDFSSFSSQQVETIQGDEDLQQESKKAFIGLEEKVRGLEESVQTLVDISKNMDKALSVGQSNATALALLKQQLETVQEGIAAQDSEKQEVSTALFIAISSLKNAIERGGSYINELKTLQQLAPSMDGFDLLQKTAERGLPNSAQLSDEFARVADAIVRMQNSVASDAAFSKRIWAWIKGLVVARPIGNIEGMTLEAIAARMEVAIQAGDYEKALSEWQTLPQNAKDVSMDFVHQLERHIAIHQLLQKLLFSAQQGSVKATKR
ncbi:COG4223 family protein [Bartonella machadoae]|uniref:COG4223 family protein n=1 Tax=Bartonella machadoae TaxID=2893471 RepID=UPI001F4CC4BF|nr:hypothetical protein [Bartonella machadoae]UNE54144.1 hypothetical protein LNM86_11530 [Bartonella machadoae]